MFKYLLKKNLALLVAVIMLFAILPGSALAEGAEGLKRLSAEEGTRGQISSGSGTWISGKLTYTYSVDSNGTSENGAAGTVSASGNTLTVTATNSKEVTGCSAAEPQPTTTTVTVTNASSYPLKINTLTSNNATIGGVSQGDVIASGATFTISVTAPAVSSSTRVTGTVTIAVEEQTSVTITLAPSPYVSYTVNGHMVAQNGTNESFTVDVGTTITLPVITAPDGYVFKGWRIGNNLITGSSFIVDAAYTVFPVIAKNTVDPDEENFKVGSSFYAFWEDAVAAAIASGGVIIVNADVTLPNNVLDNMLPAAGGTYVKPATGGVEYILPAGVTLLVPKNATATVHTTPEYEYKAHVDPYAFRTLTVPNGATITVNGAVCADSTVCGYGQNSASWNGTPSGPHGKIVMKTGSEMIFNSGANLYCWGYINGDGNIYIKSGANVYECFQLRCWRGGTATSNWQESSRVFPMNQYYVQNVEAPMRLYKGATEYVCTCVNASSSYYAANSIEFIGSNGMFKLTGNNTDYITKRYHANVDRLEVAVNGNMSLNALNIKISGLPIIGTIDVKSSDYVLPINNMEITVESGTTSIASTQTYGVAFLPSSKLTVNEGATFSVNAPTYFYDAAEWVGKGYGAGGADIVVVGYSTANGTTAIRTSANLKDAEIDNNGTVTVSNKLYTTESGAAITSSKGTGVINFTTAPATGTATTYQATQSGTDIAYHEITINNAWLYNGDDSYSYTVSTGVSTWKYDKPGEHWYRYLVDFNYNGQRIARDYYCELNDTVTYDASWLAGVSASVTSGSATASVSGTNVNVTNVTADSVITLTGTAAEFIPTFVLSEKEYAKYRLYTGNTISNTTTINGAAYYIVDQASTALAVGTAYDAPSDASMGVTEANHNTITWNMSGISATSGNPYLGIVPAGETAGGPAYIYGFYTGVVAYNSYTDEYYPTLIGAFEVLPQDVTATITLLADCGTFEEESGTVAYTAYPANNITLDLNGHHAVGRIVNNGTFTLELNGGSFEYVTGATAAAATYRGIAAIVNNGSMTVQDSAGNGKITADAISDSSTISLYNAVIYNKAGAALNVSNAELKNLEASVNNNCAVLLNYGTASITDSTLLTNRGHGIYNYSPGRITNLRDTAVSVNLAAGAYAVYNNTGSITTIDNCELSTLNTYVLRNENGGTITTLKDSELTITTPTTKNVYVVFNYGGTITTIDNCTITGNSGINNRNQRGSNTIAQGYNISKYGTIDTITNSTVSVGQYAIYNGGRINTLSNSTFTAAPASAQVPWPSGTAALNGNSVHCYTIVNSNLWWYDTAVWKRTDTNVDNNGTTMLQRRIDEYKTGDEFMPTIGTITDCTIEALNTSNSSSYGYFALQNLGVINTITGSTTITAKKHPDNAKSVYGYYALRNESGGKIGNIASSVTISAYNYALANIGARYAQTDVTYSTTYLVDGKLKSGSLATDYDYTYADVSYIGSTAATITATSQYAILNYSKIGSITGIVSANYNVIVNFGAAVTTTGIEGTTANSRAIEHRYFENNDSSTTANENRRYFEYTRNTTDGCYIGTINATVTATGAGYYAISNQGYIGTIAGTVTTPTGKASYPLIYNGNQGNQRQATLKQDEYYYTETNGAGATKYLREYTYLAPTIDTISCTATNPQDYTIQNYGVINNLTGDIRGKTITVANETGYYLTRKSIMFYYSEKLFATTKGSSEVNYEYTKGQATIGNINSATIKATNGATALRNYGHIGMIQGSTITSTGASTIINANVNLTVTNYTSNRLDVLVGCVPSSSACALAYDTTQTINENETCAIALIDLIGAGNTVSGTNNVIDNKGEITAIDSGSGTLTTITATGGIAVNNYQGSYNSRINTAAELTNSTGTLTNHYTYTYVPAEIGTIKNVYIQSTQNAIKNGEGSADYVPVRIGEIGDGAEFKSGNGYSAVYNYSSNAQIEKITGGIFTSGTGNAYGLYNDSTTYPIEISGGDFKGASNTRANAIFEPDNTNRQTYPAGLTLSTGTEDVTFHDGETGTGYYYLASSYTVTFKNGDVTFAEQQVESGQSPAYPETDPVYNGAETGTHAFVGWKIEGDEYGTVYAHGDALPAVTGDVTYLAQYSVAYTITWKVEGQEDVQTTVTAGETPVYPGEAPTKPGDAQYAYTFTGWDPEIVPVTGDATYTAQFSSTVNSYTVTWKMDDGTVIDTTSVPYGETPAYTGATPTKPADAQYTYTFAGWSASQGGAVIEPLSAVTGNVTYYAVFHKWGAPEWSWDGYTGATATFTCANDSNHIETVTASITNEVTTAATCESAGVRTFTASATFNGRTYTDSITQTLQALGHDWEAPTYVWAADNSTVTATRVCERDANHIETETVNTTPVTVPATCTENGSVTYTATFANPAFTEQAKVIVTAATGHSWGAPAWHWSEDHMTATATFTCANDASHVETVNADITSEDGYGVDAGYTLYTAEVELDGETYYDVVRVGNTYTITFDPNGGDGTAYQQTFVFDENQGVTLIPNTFTREGYGFLGWSEDRNATEYEYGDEATTSFFGDTTLYAIWKINTFTVRFFVGETCIDTQTVEYGKSAAEPEYSAYIPAGHYLIGWEQDYSCITADIDVDANIGVYQYTITFVNEDGTVLQTGPVNYGDTPAYTGATPEKEASGQYTYIFTGWDPEIVPVTGDATYTAQFSRTENTYTVTWMNHDGNVLDAYYNVPYGTVPSYNGEIPTKNATQQYAYYFAGWSDGSETYGVNDTLPIVTGNVTYTAVFDEVLRTYTVIWKNDDGTVLKTDENVEYGTTPTYDGQTPTKAATAQYTYTFAGWTPEVVPVTGPATYTAAYTSTVNSYTVTFVDWDGTPLNVQTVEYGLAAEEPDDPTRVGYTFTGWDVPYGYITSDLTVTAQYEINTYTVTWKYDSGNNIDTTTVEHGAKPFHTDAAKASDEQYSYTFLGWKKENDPDETIYTNDTFEPVTGDITFVACFESTLRTYVLTLDPNGGVGEPLTQTLPYGVETVIISNTYTKTGYDFAGWNTEPDGSGDRYGDGGNITIYEDTVLYAQWLIKTCTIFYYVDGEIVYSEDHVYGSEVTPYVYTAPEGHTFSGWQEEIPAVMPDHDVIIHGTTSVNQYTVTFTVNGTYYATGVFEYGKPVTAPEYAVPAGHTFSGWDCPAAMPAEDITLNATLTVDQYTILFVNWNGDVLQSTPFAYGVTPGYNGETPERSADEDYTYTFAGWDPAIVQVTGSATYTAVFHSWGAPTWAWADDHMTATATFTCGHCETEHVETAAATVATVNATCTANGTTTYTAKVTYNGREYTEDYTETIPALEHDWVFVGFTWTEITDGYTAVANYVCGHDNTHTRTETAAVTSETTPATCEAAGQIVYTASYDGHIDTKTVTIPAPGHDWDAPAYEWIQEGADWKCTATRVCKRDNDHSESETVTAVRTESGNTAIYTAAFTNSAFETQTKEVEIAYYLVGTMTNWEVVETYKFEANPVVPGEYMQNVDDLAVGTQLKVVRAEGTRILNWYPDNEGNYTVDYPHSGNVNVYFRPAGNSDWYYFHNGGFFYISKTHTVTVIAGEGGNAAATPENPDYTQTVTLSITPDEGHSFDRIEFFKRTGAGEDDIEPVTLDWNETARTFTMPDFDVVIKVYFEVNYYTIKWIVDGNEETQTYAYGATPAYPGGTPTKPADDQYTYTFTGWEPEITTVTGDATYTAVFSATVNTYTITWVIDGESTTETYAYGATPAYTGETPTKPADAQYTYTFDCWTPEIVPVTGDAVYTAVFSSTVNKYTVIWKNYDGEILETDKDVSYGTIPTYNGQTPAKPGDAEHSYTFNGWDPAVSEVHGDIVYTAQFTEATNTYTVTWNNYDGSLLEEDKDVAYGETPEYNGETPAKPSDDEFDYSFIGWTPEITTVTGNTVYTATFEAVRRSYEIKFVNYNNSPLLTINVPYGETPEYTGETPTKPADDQYTYAFGGWDPAIVPVTGTATYTAQFSGTLNTYTVTWIVEGVSTEVTYEYGATPVYPGETPTKDSDAQYTYAFSGWDPEITDVTGDATYTAQFSQTVNTYTITWMIDGVPTTEIYEYGATPTHADPAKDPDEQNTYTFTGWDPDITEVTGDATYTAQFASETRKYTITWTIDGVETTTDVPYGTVPEYPGGTPSKPSDGLYDYTFAGWSPELTEVTGEASYTAVFDKALNDKGLTVSVELTAAAAIDRTYLFEIGKGGEVIVIVPVTVKAGALTASVLVKGLDAEERYTVREITLWSWDYEVTNGSSQTAAGNGEVLFINKRRNKGWLFSEAWLTF